MQRGEVINQASHDIERSRIVPNNRNFMKSTGNKKSLVAFVSNYLLVNVPPRLTEHQQLIIAGGFGDGQEVYSIESIGHTILQDLRSTHEEADTRMVLHAIHLAHMFPRLVVRSDDTDVLVILLYYYSLGLMGKEVYMHAGHVGTNTNRQRYIPVHIISDKLGKNVCKCLPAAHALTGCDTTSGIFRIGKCTAYTKLLQNNLELTPLGSFANLAQNEAETVACKYALLLYGVKKRKMEPVVQN